MGEVGLEMIIVLIILLPLINTQMGQTGFTLGCLKPEREALLTFKASVFDDEANVLFSWKGGDCCSWHGVTCHNATRRVLRLDLRCDDQSENPLYSYYPYVYLGSTCSLGFSELNPSLLELRQLRYLDLGGNQFSFSHIPEWIGSMKHLRYFNLSNGGFGGGVPPQLGNLTRLRALDLSGNFDSYWTNLHWLSSLVNLRCLGMSNTTITTEALNTLPQVLGHLPLLDLRLRRTGIGNHLLSSIFSNSTLASRLQHLDVSMNNLEGSIPHILSNMTSLKFLDLSYNKLNGFIPLWLKSMKGLEFLSLSGNDFSYPLFSHSTLPSTIQHLRLSRNNLEGPLPLFLSNMTSLRFLSLDRCQFNGSIPLWLGKLKDLEYLDLSRNRFSHVEGGTIMGILGNLCHLDLSWNNLEGSIPHILSNMTSLKFLDLSYSQLNGSYPLFSHSTLPSTIQHLRLSGNNLEGPFPHFLSNMTSLGSLALADCQLNGSIPLWLGNMKDLEYLHLSGNRFSHVEGGTIMGILGNLCHLKTLILRSSIVGGNFLGLNHDNFANCVEYDLEYLDLTFNNITNTLPKWLGELRNLKFIELYGNTFYGPIPSAIGNISSLIELDLNSCNLWGTIPTSFGGLSSLEKLDLSNNFLDGSIPTSLGSLSSLQILDLSNNFLDGSIPTSLGSLSSLQNELSVLYLSNNRLFGEIIDWIPNVNLQEINLSNNHIMGPIPHFFPSSQLRYIDLSYNLLSGPMFNDSSSEIGVVKAPLCHLEILEFLHLQRNQLSGTIPDCWGTSEVLSVIDLSSNKLSGSIPMTIGLLPNMAYLKLNNNSLEGTLPPTLNELSQLVILDIGENKLSGEVPHWDADSHPFLEIAIMRANQLEGVIPSQLCSLPGLQFLDLAMNNLTGSIPSCFGHFKSMKKSLQLKAPSTYEMPLAPGPAPPESFKGENAMVVLKGVERQYTTTLKLVVNLDLSSNGLVGSIPEELTNLSKLVGLNLSNNHLTGIIPLNIGEMGSLESLDLSKNNLSGTIPSSMSALTSLSSLNLSSNMLHGEIPTGNQLQTLNDPSIYGHNAGLCGDPLPKCGGKHVKQQPDEEEEEVESTLEKVMFYIVVMLGFATGFWGVVGSLLYSRTWRHALFRRVEYVTDFLYVQLVVKIKRLKN